MTYSMTDRVRIGAWWRVVTSLMTPNGRYCNVRCMIDELSYVIEVQGVDLKAWAEVRTDVALGVVHVRAVMTHVQMIMNEVSSRVHG